MTNSCSNRVKKWLKSRSWIGILAMFFSRVLSGYWAYKKVLTAPGLPSGSMAYFIDYAGSGDTYLCCSYLACQHKITDHAVFVAAGALSGKIATLFGFDHMITLTRQQAFSMRIMGRFYGGKLKLYPLLYESEPLRYSGILRHMQGFRGVDFMTMLRIGFCASLGVEYGQTEFRPVPLPYDVAYLDKVFHDLRLEEGKTVLLAPYAGQHDTWGIPMELYERLAVELRAQGFVVCTNSCGQRKEPTIPGTIPVFLPHEYMAPFCERAGYFIGIRSGLCDMIASARMKRKIILYPGERLGEGVATWLEFFSLRQMGLCEDAVEIEYDKECGAVLQGYVSCIQDELFRGKERK